MSCKKPLKGFQIGLTDNGKPKYKICNYDVQCVFTKLGEDDWHKSVYPINSHTPGYRVVSEYIEIPCGKCIGCRLKSSRDWADRCMLEAMEHQQNCFVTLTYDDDHLQLSHSKDILGLEYHTPTLVPKHVTNFLKRLRKSGAVFKYYLCGEYGSHTLRPHYHICFFGYMPDDLTIYKQSELGYTYYNSESLSKLWSMGFAVVSELTWETAAYTARYCMKKAHNDLSTFYEQYNLVPEFVRMSRRPGIANNYYVKHKNDIFEDDTMYIRNNKGVQPRKPP